MIEILYPEPKFKVRHQNGMPFIFDDIRKKWLLLQEEEWVRQNFVQYLIRVMNYPKALIALEKEIIVGELKKRFDILVYDRKLQPWLLVECKSADVALSGNTLLQALRYHIALPASFLIITNGDTTMGWEKTNHNLHEIAALPAFPV